MTWTHQLRNTFYIFMTLSLWFYHSYLSSYELLFQHFITIYFNFKFSIEQKKELPPFMIWHGRIHITFYLFPNIDISISLFQYFQNETIFYEDKRFYSEEIPLERTNTICMRIYLCTTNRFNHIHELKRNSNSCHLRWKRYWNYLYF